MLKVLTFGRMFGQRKIDFLVIGAQKCGTSSFYQYLAENLMIEPAKTKEIHFFDFFHAKGKAWYHGHFNFKKGTLCGEASPFYIFHPKVAERVKKYNPKTKLIVLLRDPVERAISHYRMNIKKGFDDRPFSEAIRAEEVVLAGKINPDMPGNALQQFSYKSRGLYAVQLHHWLKYFNKDQLLVLNYHHFFTDPWQQIQPVYRFLKVAPYFGTLRHFHKNRANDTFEISAEDRAYLEDFFKKPNRQLAEQYHIHFE